MILPIRLLINQNSSPASASGRLFYSECACSHRRRSTHSSSSSLASGNEQGGVPVSYKEESSILQDSTKKVKYISAPIFYVNSKPHIGHLYTAVMADFLAKWYELKGFKTIFSIGTDEHGLKIQQAALAAKMEPLAFCDNISQEFHKLFDVAKVNPTDFIRTSEPRHYKAVQSLWKKLVEGGWIYKGYHEGWYSVSDETFVPLSQIEERPNGKGGMNMYSRETGKIVEWTKEENYKFKLSKFREPLIAWLEANEKLIVPLNQYREVLGNLKENELEDLSISRLKTRVHWGIPVPGDESHVIYVWLDALTNYLTISGYPEWSKNGFSEDQIEEKGWPPSWHIIGKDIVKFHAIYWPAFLMATNLPLPKRILSHGHWLIENQKMSKSSGNGVDPITLMEKFGVDGVRYFLLRDGGININPEYSMNTVWKRYKHDLGGHLGNLMMRSTSLKINPTGIVPDSPVASLPFTEEEVDILKCCREIRNLVDECVEEGLFSDALAHITALIASINRYWSIVEPWHFKPEENDRLTNVLYVSFEGIRVAAILFQPVMITSSSSILETLQVPQNERTFHHAVLGGCSRKGRIVKPATPLFPSMKQI